VELDATGEYPIRIAPGDLLCDKYRVERVLGSGGMGVVVSATHVKLGQMVAIKLLRDELKGTPRLVGRFMREARAASRLRGENAVRILDVDESEGRPLIVMEYLEGEDSHSIIHRDLKPANLFLTTRADGAPLVKLLDLGISKVLVEDESVHQLTGPTSMLGSPSYMSPEQLRNPAGVDVRSDIWSLGVVLYQLLTKRLPFSATNSAALAAHIAADPPKSPDLEGPAKMAEPIILRCLEKRPEDRYADVAELAEALAPCVARGAEQAQRVRKILEETNEETNDADAKTPAPAEDPFLALAAATGSWPARKSRWVYWVPLLIPLLLYLSWVAGHRHRAAPVLAPPPATVERKEAPVPVATEIKTEPAAVPAAAEPISPPTPAPPSEPARKRVSKPRPADTASERHPMDIQFK
jgi:serine/threonine-protein kinase